MGDTKSKGRHISNKGKSGFFVKRKIATEKFLKALGFTNIEIVGDLKHPNFIRDGKEKLPMRFHKGGLVISQSFDRDSDSIKVNVFDFNLRDISNKIGIIFRDMKSTPVHTIKYFDLYLHELKYLHPNTKDGTRYPVFSPVKPKVIYTEEHAQEIIDELEQQGVIGLEVQ